MGTGQGPLTAVSQQTQTEALRQWLSTRRGRSGLQCLPITWSAVRGWSVHDGAIVHELGAFFSIVGVDVSAAGSVDGVTRLPLILQREIGILGLLLYRSGEGVQALVHAKTEPGNVQGTQLAPTVQATESNYMRRHGGASTPHLEWFTGGTGDILADTLQSEQGTRFLRKRNRNVTAITGESVMPASGRHRWFPAPALLDLLHEDFSVNTDLRSVLVCSDWRELCVSRDPFHRADGDTELHTALRESYCTPAESPDDALPMAGGVVAGPPGIADVSVVPIEALPEWEIDPRGLMHTGHGLFDVRLVRVRANDREVPAWDQPLLCNRRVEECTLVCQRRDRVLHLLLRTVAEPGLPDGPELGPSLRRDDRFANRKDPVARWLGEETRVTEHARVRQSDEGGRFGWCVAIYRLVEVPPGSGQCPGEDVVWLTVSQVQALARRSGMLTNEARSAISLLLYYL